MARLRLVTLALGVALGLLVAPRAALAFGEDQHNRAFGTLGFGPLIPTSNDFDDAFDVSLHIEIDGGYLLRLGDSPLAIAPHLGFKVIPLNEDNDIRDFVNATAYQLFAGAKIGFVGKGLFAYGQADVGLNILDYEACFSFLGCMSGDESDFMVRFGGGADFSVWTYLAVGGQALFQIVVTDDTDGYSEDAMALEVLVYAKFLFPEKPMK